ncbi:MAG: hypothetical protein IKV48_08255 [Eggerthellaceae bacterium]|nr:hypothetical protein [Eggerthellaceae bacterium]
MTQHDRRRAAMSNAFKYQQYKAEINAYIDSCMALTGKQQLGGSAVTSGHRSDPTARAAIKLAEMPEHLRTKALWVRAVNDAWRECREDSKEIAYLFEHNFRLTGDILGPEHNTAVRNDIIDELNISVSTFYEWLENVADILVYHATKRKLL